MLEWAKIQLDEVPLNPHILNLKPSLVNSLTLYENLTLEKNIPLSEVNIPQNQIMTDQNMFDTILRNLIQTAINFTHLGGSLVVSAHTDRSGCGFRLRTQGLDRRSNFQSLSLDTILKGFRLSIYSMKFYKQAYKNIKISPKVIYILMSQIAVNYLISFKSLPN